MSEIKLEAILARTYDFGIGYQDGLPWPRNSIDMKHFQQTTDGAVLIVGARTALHLPKLLGRKLYIIDRLWLERMHRATFNNPSPKARRDYLLKQLNKAHPDQRYIIAGGGYVYDLFLEDVDLIHESIIPGYYGCDTYINDYTTKYTARSTNSFKVGDDVLSINELVKRT